MAYTEQESFWPNDFGKKHTIRYALDSKEKINNFFCRMGELVNQLARKQKLFVKS
jgi:hypothetical protein